MSQRGGARKGAGRKPTGKTKALGFFSLRLTTLSRLEREIKSGQRSSFVDQAICDALGKPAELPMAPEYNAPKPFEIV